MGASALISTQRLKFGFIIPSMAFFTLNEAVDLLRKHYGSPDYPPTSNPFELILWVNVAYLASTARRRDAFELLKSTIGTDPAAILSADRQALENIASRGILKGTFASKLQECARIVIADFGGDLEAVVRLPLQKAKKALQTFPGIGEPGAEKILLFTGRQALLAPESNGLRVLVRLGLVQPEESYARMYAASRETAKDFPADIPMLQEAHQLLERHGHTLCKRSGPICDACPLVHYCPSAR